jgi:glutamate/tyrosine decarboxylase-like PLP-dependent enzyme
MSDAQHGDADRAYPLEPDAAQRARILELTVGFAEEFLASVPHERAYIERLDRGRALLDSPIDERGIGLEATLDLIRDHVVSVGVNPTSGRFLGYIPGGGLFHSAIGDFLAAVTNRYAGVFFAGPGAVRIENQLLRWMAEIIGYPEGSAGYLGAGGSMANLTAIVTARDHDGIHGADIPRSVVYLTDHAHHCIDKALRLAGLKDCPIRRIAVDDRFRMDADALEQAIERDQAEGLRPWLVVSSAGTTNTGSVDPLADIAEIAEGHGLWHHVDAAYGGFFVLCPEGADLLSDMHRSDSIVMDPHKTLFLPYGTGALIVRDRDRLLASHTSGGDYMQDALSADDELSPADLSPELTKHFRGLRLWLPLKVLGLAPFRDALSEKIQLARHFHEQLSTIEGYELGPEPELSVVTFRYRPKHGDPDAFNRRLVQEIHRDGRVFLSSTKIKDQFILRMAAVCFRTHKSDIDETLDVLAELPGRIQT